jgi:hypothetical protein
MVIRRPQLGQNAAVSGMRASHSGQHNGRRMVAFMIAPPSAPINH